MKNEIELLELCKKVVNLKDELDESQVQSHYLADVVQDISKKIISSMKAKKFSDKKSDDEVVSKEDRKRLMVLAGIDKNNLDKDHFKAVQKSDLEKLSESLQENSNPKFVKSEDGVEIKLSEHGKERWQKMAGILPLSEEEKFFNLRADLEKSGGFDYEEDGNFIGMSGVQISTKPLSYDDHIAKMSEGLSKAKTSYFIDFGNDKFDKGKMDEFLESWKEKVGGLNDK